MKVIGRSILRKIYKKRDPYAHKYDYGSLLIIGGSKLYSGSPGFAALSAIAAYKAGVDLVTVVAPQRAADIVASFSPDMITYPLKGEYVKRKHVKILLKLAKDKDAFVIGSGMERKKDTLAAINDFLRKINIPGVIDADAIHAIKDKRTISNKKFIITPHTREFFVLTGNKIHKKPLKEKTKIVNKAAKKLNDVILLKGNPDIISDGNRVVINKTGNPYMTKGGTGDTLAGIAGSLLAQGISAFDAACGAAYINGKAGDIVAKKKKHTMLASDIIAAIERVALS